MSKPRVFSASGTSVRAATLIGACILVIAFSRVARAAFFPDLPNFSPISALAFCGGLFLPGMVAWLLPFGALFLSDILLNVVIGYPLFSDGQAAAWFCILGIIGLGRWMASRDFFSLGSFFIMLFSGSLLFYLVTNAACWIFNTAYPRGWDGLWMSLTSGMPGFPPTWTFFRNSLISDFLFAGLLLSVWIFAGSQSPAHQKAFVKT